MTAARSVVYQGHNAYEQDLAKEQSSRKGAAFEGAKTIGACASRVDRRCMERLRMGAGTSVAHNSCSIASSTRHRESGVTEAFPTGAEPVSRDSEDGRRVESLGVDTPACVSDAGARYGRKGGEVLGGGISTA